jgi:hypothetical protein
MIAAPFGEADDLGDRIALAVHAGAQASLSVASVSPSEYTATVASSTTHMRAYSRSGAATCRRSREGALRGALSLPRIMNNACISG